MNNQTQIASSPVRESAKICFILVGLFQPCWCLLGSSYNSLDRPPDSAAQPAGPNWFLGNCGEPIQQNEKGSEGPWNITICSRGFASLSSSSSSETSAIIQEAKIYTGLHFLPNHSIRLQAKYEKTRNTKKKEEPPEEQRRIEYLAYQIGNPASTRVSALIGRQKLPFALEVDPIPGFSSYFLSRVNRMESSQGIKINYTNLRNIIVELAALSSREEMTKINQQALRVGYDLPTYGRTKLLLSVAQSAGENKRISFAAVTLSPEGTRVMIEWNKTLLSETNIFDLDGSFFSMTMTSKPVRGSFSLLSYQHSRSEGQILTIGRSVSFGSHVEVNAALSRRTQTSTENFLLGGLLIKL